MKSAHRNGLLLLIGMPLFVFSNGRWTVPVLAWVAPAVLLAWMRATRPRVAVPLLPVLVLAAARVMLYGIIPDFLGALTWILTAYFALLWFLPYLADRILVRDPGDFLSTLVFPCAAVALEFANAIVFGDWTSLALTQADHLPLMQAVSLAGLWPLTFLIAWFGPLLLWARARGFAWRRIGRAATAYAGIVGAVLVFGGLRLALAPKDVRTVRVVSVHLSDEKMGDLGIRYWNSSPSGPELEKALAIRRSALEAYMERSLAAAARGADVLIWPEAAMAVRAEDEPGLLERGAAVAREASVYFLVAYHLDGAGRPGGRGANMAVLFDPSGRAAWTYSKAHPVPGSTDEAGDGRIPVIETPFGRLATAICYDMDFPALLRQAGRRKADVVLVPAWDWRAIDPLHARMAAVRAVENGFSMVRSTAEGLSLAVDSRGRTVAALDHFATADRVMTADVPVRGARTLYPWIGDAFAWLAIAGLAGLAVRRARPRGGTAARQAPAGRPS